MLIPDNIHPEQTIYYNGSFVLKIIQKKQVIDMFELYIQVTRIREMNISVFMLCLDWLFLLNLLKISGDNEVELCS